ncbi:MAG TPA: NADH-quinone oxidoreductase subunit C [Nitrospinaceae bacterium]|jgi:NADH-quinone oxidoreductase subunit C|nr:NADH-quinone oxidoreductase subunit C [Nitrospinaceae bacterium]HJL72664.1 NADH-quinone oxidoreductase subunit C [Nitrospinaceae bacterium]HJO00469.1 NADH-quinone oxidoreductase subunit C [Nitrospinaceae bacterium]
MTSEEIIEKVKSDQGEDIQSAEVNLGDAVIFVAPGALHKVAGYLMMDADLNFDYLSHITGADYLNEDRDPRFEVVYEFHSIDKNHSIRMRVGLEEEDPTIPTVSDLWRGALYPERELFDMFGFKIMGHPNLSRLIMPDEWGGHPLLKDYPLTTEDIAFSHNRDFKQDLVKTKPPTR